MIDPKLLTPENGFAIGTAIETVRIDDGVPIGVYGVLTETVLGLIQEFHDYIESIRPLTGTMAIWNFAPEWAKSVTVSDLGDISWHDDEDPSYEQIGVVMHGNRPEWAKVKP